MERRGEVVDTESGEEKPTQRVFQNLMDILQLALRTRKRTGSSCAWSAREEEERERWKEEGLYEKRSPSSFNFPLSTFHFQPRSLFLTIPTPAAAPEARKITRPGPVGVLAGVGMLRGGVNSAVSGGADGAGIRQKWLHFAMLTSSGLL